jgi:hydroxymethylpyrimidine/phosphomethylpyrimidine kinase
MFPGNPARNPSGELRSTKTVPDGFVPEGEGEHGCRDFHVKDVSASPAPHLVLCFSGHDPTGGAGIQADCETIATLGGHAMSVVTCLTVQDTRNVKRILPQRPADFLEQARALLADVRPSAFKIGLIGSAALAEAIADLLTTHPDIPVVLDPVLSAGGGAELADRKLRDILLRRLMPRVSLITPNGPEVRRLSGESDLHRAAARLLESGCRYVLVTGGHEDQPEVINTLYGASLCQTSRWKRLPHVFHGSGCTLAAACAALVARGMNVPAATREAQKFVWNALASGFRPGQGQHLPRRIAGERP